MKHAPISAVIVGMILLMTAAYMAAPIAGIAVTGAVLVAAGLFVDVER